MKKIITIATAAILLAFTNPVSAAPQFCQEWSKVCSVEKCRTSVSLAQQCSKVEACRATNQNTFDGCKAFSDRAIKNNAGTAVAQITQNVAVVKAWEEAKAAVQTMKEERNLHPRPRFEDVTGGSCCTWGPDAYKSECCIEEGKARAAQKEADKDRYNQVLIAVAARKQELNTLTNNGKDTEAVWIIAQKLGIK